jgi:hypothetical protein
METNAMPDDIFEVAGEAARAIMAERRAIKP